MNPAIYSRFFLGLSIFTWLLLLSLHWLPVFVPHLPIYQNHTLGESIPITIFILSTFFFYKYEISVLEHGGFIELLWKTFITGGFCLGVATSVESVETFVPQWAHLPIMDQFIHLVEFAMITIFACSNFFMFKKLALYNKSLRLARSWAVYEYVVILMSVFHFFSPDIFQLAYYVVLTPVFLFGSVLSFNVKWVAYLNTRLKWLTLLLLLLLLAMCSIFVYSIFYHSYYADPLVDPARLLFLVSLLGFVFSYSMVASLVVIFNLPTSSVFERKFEEVINVQRLSESFMDGKSEKEIFELLLMSSKATVWADAAWIENDDKILLKEDIEDEDILNVKTCLAVVDREGNNELFIVRKMKEAIRRSSFLTSNYSSVVMVTLQSQKNKLGQLYLAKKVKDGFDNEMLNILRTYVAQAVVSIENLRLIEKAIENERYLTELVTAREVQKRLLPEGNLETDYFQLSAFCQTSEEMGGDYYDYYAFSDKKYVFVVGDVSGKGTSAAFNLAQVKGIFQGLVPMGLSPSTFINQANLAVGKCLEKSSFVTLTYCMLDAENQHLTIARAGHCPPYFFSKEPKEGQFFRQKGIGLGIIRNKNIENHLEPVLQHVHGGDLLVLYSDGLTEARNDLGEEYGYQRLKDFIDSHFHLPIDQLQTTLLADLEKFTYQNLTRDDLTLLFVKFK